jgi:hypothetical protein
MNSFVFIGMGNARGSELANGGPDHFGRRRRVVKRRDADEKRDVPIASITGGVLMQATMHGDLTFCQ